MTRPTTRLVIPLLPALALALAGAARAAVPLPALNIDPAQITVSGLSSGGFMANQLGYAHSATFSGVGVFAAGPYMCAGHSSYTACMYGATIGAAALSTLQADLNNWSGTAIDPLARVAAQKVYLFVGSSDYTVGAGPMAAVATQYRNNGVTTANLLQVQRAGTAHTFPTDFDSSGNNACGSSASPYISNCGYDGAKAVLGHFYGALAPRNDSPAAANYLEFDQTAYGSNPGMAATGWLYLPADCAGGARCRLHVALHGCQQNSATIGQRFVRDTGYTRWADSNHIVVLFPQTRVDSSARPTAASGSLPNSNGCWDWIGWYGNNFAQRGGSQIGAIKAMVDRLAGGGTGGGGGTGPLLPAPTGLVVGNVGSSSAELSWSAVAGAAGYRVYRNGTAVSPAGLTATRYADTGLAPATAYTWSVAALDAAGTPGTVSAPVSARTTGAAATCFTASNYAHVSAGRATLSGAYALARGSGQNLGLWNVFVTTTLKQTGPAYYVLGTCP